MLFVHLKLNFEYYSVKANIALFVFIFIGLQSVFRLVRCKLFIFVSVQMINFHFIVLVEF